MMNASLMVTPSRPSVFVDGDSGSDYTNGVTATDVVSSYGYLSGYCQFMLSIWSSI